MKDIVNEIVHSAQLPNQEINTSSLDKKVKALECSFLSRRDWVAISSPFNNKPMPVRPASLVEALSAHMSSKAKPAIYYDKHSRKVVGNFRVGTYLPNTDGTTQAAIIDLDGGKGKAHPLKNVRQVSNRIVFLLSEYGFKPNVEVSGSGDGVHIWILFDRPVNGKLVRNIFNCILDQEKFELLNGGLANHRSFKGIEIFPKQDIVDADKFGNLVWLPWWHGAKNGCCEFLNADSFEVQTTPVLIISCAAILEKFKFSNKSIKSLQLKPANVSYSSKLEPVIELSELNLCHTFTTILWKIKKPELTVTHSERFLFAQIARHAGLTVDEISIYFSKRHEFNLKITKDQINSVNLKYPPPKCRNISLRTNLCNGRCDNLKKCGGGSPIAFLKNNDKKNGGTDEKK